jgi:ABC-type branched-subunit amino acid transport system substrate-binding protein
VGVLLPLHGKFEKFGRKALQAVELAFKIFHSSQEGDAPFTLAIRDSGEDVESTLRALNDLYLKDHVIAVIGPLLSKGIDAVTQRAQELGVPLLNLSQQPGTSGDFIFASGITPRLQAQEVARYAVEELKLNRFAIVHPKDKFGEQYSQEFWTAVEKAGGKITAIETYPPNETDFRQMIEKLTGRYYTESRQKELEELAKLREENKITKRSRKTQQYYDLPPLIDFDAVFIPDEPKLVAQLLPTFSYMDVDQMKFLGISTWNSPEFLSRAQNYAEGAVIVDHFYAASSQPHVQKFVNQYQKYFGELPGQIEATAYDAAQVLESVLTKSLPRNRQEARDSLAKVHNFLGVTGRMSVKEGAFARTLTVLTVKNQQFVPVSTR